MDKNIKYFENIWIDPPIDRILYRLGYKKNKTRLDENQMANIEEIIWEGVSFCHPRGAFLILPITKKTKNSVTIGKHLIESKSLAELLKDSKEVVLAASTIGMEIIDKIQDEIKKENSIKAVIFDSTASQVADKTVAWIMDFVNKSLEKEAKKITSFRYSPGYGDLGLEYQKIFFEELQLEKIGMKLTKTYMMVPEKSVTAICGIEDVRKDE
ncbi:vitamin B12 dependent-methionine synthase activation domain-containing protein [Defluviitalea phaphyphila]|uniref:vitamin B12 dependent-methionine synthase activation domain-containing protein n=1 Tax=Defluviitalea phaphyphila TaxID=1473580 RepID=UPI0007311FCA|nr:vitamin B12 dependent-methionine synthase activation domain-containing protein [Defluviitalea phaphyphila]